MTRIVPVLSATCVLGIGLVAWSKLTAGEAAIAVPQGRGQGERDGAAANGQAPSPLAAALADARRQCTLPAIDAAIAPIEAATASADADAASWHLLAKALLERSQIHSHLRGIRVGEPVWPELPEGLADDIARGLEAVAHARAAGDDSGDLYRIEAGLMSQQITGIATALQWNARIGKALRAAGERSPDDARLHVALGLQKLLAPRWLGHDPEQALAHFKFAAKARPHDERPAVFAAMACQLQSQRTAAIEWLEQATARNPHNRFAKAVLARLRRGEDDPFGRDVTATELEALE